MWIQSLDCIVFMESRNFLFVTNCEKKAHLSCSSAIPLNIPNMSVSCSSSSMEVVRNENSALGLFVKIAETTKDNSNDILWSS
jgi:hypothetical protein